MPGVVLSEWLDQVGRRISLPPDQPAAGADQACQCIGSTLAEIASAAAAIISGQHDLGRG